MADYGDRFKVQNFEEADFSSEWFLNGKILSVVFQGHISHENHLQALQQSSNCGLEALEYTLTNGMTSLLLDFHEFYWTYQGEEIPAIQSRIDILKASNIKLAVIIRDDPQQWNRSKKNMRGHGEVFFPDDPGIDRWMEEGQNL